MSELSDARAEARLRRAALIGTAQEVQQRLKPAAIAENAVESAKRKGEAIADGAVDAVRRRPVTASAAAAGVSAFVGFAVFKRFFKSSKQDEE